MSHKYIPHLLGLLLVTTFFAATSAPQNTPPRLVAIIIIDQCSYHYIPKLRHHFRYGLKELLENGIVYTNAYHAHAIPETAPGHHALSTGTLPREHSVVLNEWFDEHYNGILYGYPAIQPSSDDPKYATLTSSQTKVDGLSDQFVMARTNNTTHHAVAISLKPQPALACAQRLGKAIWFNEYTGNFISNTNYFDKTPSWIDAFNQRLNLSKLTSLTWQCMYEPDDKAYAFPFIDNYEFASFSTSMASGVPIPIGNVDAFYKNNNGKNHTYAPYSLFLKTPHASQALIELAKETLDHKLKNKNDRLILWICLGNLDLLCHYYGPHARESIDTLYHFDKQIQEFMDYAKKQLGEENCLFALTADHGIAPIPEIMRKQGMKLAQRIMGKDLIAAMNELIKKKYNLDAVVKIYEPTFFILNKEALASVSPTIQHAVVGDLLKFLSRQEGIKRVWTHAELKQANLDPDSRESFYKNQIYRNRLGDIICMPEPYCIISNYATGTSHLSPYDYDTHVPLIVYQKGRKHRTINRKVWVGQLPGTIAHMLGINRPVAAINDLLPGIAESD
jgi:predicted AlkP superfamily pyrophosphatase or phosphodiesterase